MPGQTLTKGSIRGIEGGGKPQAFTPPLIIFLRVTSRTTSDLQLFSGRHLVILSWYSKNVSLKKYLHTFLPLLKNGWGKNFWSKILCFFDQKFQKIENFHFRRQHTIFLFCIWRLKQLCVSFFYSGKCLNSL